ncbi:hypothetical protein T484DRAFT_1756873 [Cryptophyta sp. CCMP2293]|nr:hypothetical protein T484DRAFT_1756993 [Cryptophyta sp. CCMP2293]KAJ1466150.1 hypothetical protein T484DRAFT_1756873 [Cryptophyta sp. CCMP2293]
MPNKIDLALPDAVAEVTSLAKLILVTKDHHTRNRYTARRCRLQKYILQQTADRIVAEHECAIEKLKCQVHILMKMLSDASVSVDRLALERLTLDRFYKGYVADVTEDTQRAWYEEVAMDAPMPTREPLSLSPESGMGSLREYDLDRDPWETLDVEVGVEEDPADLLHTSM